MSDCATLQRNSNKSEALIHLVNPHIPTLFTPVGNHRGVKLPPGVSPFLGHVRKKLQRLHPCIVGKTFLRCKPLYSGSRPAQEVDIAEAETGNYNICGHRRATLEIPMSSCVYFFEHQLLNGNKMNMIFQCLPPEVHIWQLPNRKPLHWRHSVFVSPVRLRTHWAIKLVVGTLNLVAFTSLPYCFFI